MVRFFEKSLWIALAAALAPSVALGAAPQPPPVRKVVVYPDRAMLTRVLEAPCGPSPSLVVFGGLPSGLDPTTLRAAVAGSGARVEGVSLYERILADEHQDKLRALVKQIEAVEVRRAEQKSNRERAQAMKAQAETLRASMGPFLAREAAAEKKPNTPVWTAGLDTARALVDEAETRTRAADAALRTLERELEDLRRRQGALSGEGPRRATDAEVVVRCGAGATARVELSYVLGGICWTPLYEARADLRRNAIDLSVRADVTQASGEDWKDVELTLSTAITRRDAKPPEPQPLHVGATPQEERRKVLVRRYEEVRHLESVDAAAPGGAGAGGLPAEDQGLSVQLRVPGLVDLSGDGNPVRVEVETLKLPARFGLVTAPKLVPHVFRSGEAVSAARYPLLPGRVDLFSAGSYLGSSGLERTAKGDKLKLAFGIEEKVKVRRVVLEEQAKDPGFLGNTRRLLYGYRIELASNDAAPMEVSVQEHLPVSQLDDVKVVVDERTTAGYELARDDGIVTWKVKLAPGEKRNLELRFAVEIPAKYDSGSL